MAALEALPQRHPAHAVGDALRARAVALGLDRPGAPARCSHSCPGTRTTPSRRSSARSWEATSSIDSSTSSIASTSRDDLGRRRAGRADLQDPAALGLDHRLAHAGVELARGLLVGGGAEPLPRGEVALVDALPDERRHPVHVVDVELVERLEPGLRRLLEQRGAGEGVVHRVRRRARRAGARSTAATAPGSAGCRPSTVKAISSSTSRCGVSTGMMNAAARVTTPRMPAHPSRNVYAGGGAWPVESGPGRTSR